MMVDLGELVCRSDRRPLVNLPQTPSVDTWRALWLLVLTIAVANVQAAKSRAALLHEWQFNTGNANDNAVGGHAHGTLHGNAHISAGQLILDGSAGTYVDLLASGPDGININTYPAVTVEVWATPSSAMTGFTTLLGFGDVNTMDPNLAANYFTLMTHRGDNVSRAAIAISNDTTPFSEEDFANGPEYNDNRQHHYAAVLTNSSISLYTDGQLRETSPLPVNGAANMISGIGTGFAKIGAGYPIDPLFIGSVNNIRLYDEARTALQIANGAIPPSCACQGPRMTIDRQTGTITFSNGHPASNVVGYSITSASGALNPAAWRSIVDNFDADSGSHSFDGDDRWTKLSTPGSKTDFSEFEFDGGNGGAFGTGTGGTTSLQVGSSGAWRKSIYEDLQIAMRLADGSDVPVQVVYSGNGGHPFKRSDLNFDDQINFDDWTIFLSHSGEEASGLTRAESYGLGDLNGDLVLDWSDFRLFKADYNGLNGAGSFEAATSVPEPTILVMLMLSCAGSMCISRMRAYSFVFQSSENSG